MHWIQISSVIFSAIAFLLMLTGTIYSCLEKEQRAAIRFGAMAILFPVVFLVPFFAGNQIVFAVWGGIEGLAILAVIVFLLPVQSRKFFRWDKPTKPIDERTIMFSRNLLQHGTREYESYYRLYPQHLKADEHFRRFPGLLSPESRYFNPATFFAAEATFNVVEQLRDMAEGTPSHKQTDVSAKDLTRFLEKWTQKLGVVSFGTTALKDYHKYSYVGRGKDYGKPVDLTHPHAIAITTEMDKEMMEHAPYGPTVMESGQQYVNSGVIALQVAQFIRNLGYEARAHIDGNYRVVCPLVAKDAGLGEIGRMGLLMTPELGPRVRIGVVTTDAPLELTGRLDNPSVIDFCMYCKKCAEVCPSNAISFEEPQEIDGIKRWQIDQEACFTLWTKMGTDCGRCVSVCPYSHPNNLLHNLVRTGLKQSAAFRKAALKMDDFFYGRKPAPRKEEQWMRVM